MTTEPKMPPLPEPEGMDVGMYYYAETVQLLYKQWAERVAELERENARLKLTMETDRLEAQGKVREFERVLGVARETLAFYADGDHFIRADPDAWDTVSGEPPNFYEDEANTATVEDGSIAKQAIATIDAARSKEGQHHD